MVLCTNGRISLYSFCMGSGILCLYVPSLIINEIYKSENILTHHWLLINIIYGSLCHVFLYVIYKSRGYIYYKISWRSALLGNGLALGLILSLLSPLSWRTFGWYISILSLFHFTEYLTTAFINPKSLSIDSFLLNHSKEYGIAAVASWSEFIIERYLFPQMKTQLWVISVCGLMLCIFGDSVRKLAMITAGTNFNHIIQSHREEGHVLVVKGIYSIFRHPSYVGWFWWSIGTQFILVNPICIIGYCYVSWNFFNIRIRDEEITLLNFFGEDYVRYQRKVSTGLPFINGYRVEY